LRNYAFPTDLAQRAILIFHAFVKKTQKAPAHEVEIARAHLKEMLDEEKRK
jgi:phage-related protein